MPLCHPLRPDRDEVFGLCGMRWFLAFYLVAQKNVCLNYSWGKTVGKKTAKRTFCHNPASIIIPQLLANIFKMRPSTIFQAIVVFD